MRVAKPTVPLKAITAQVGLSRDAYYKHQKRTDKKVVINQKVMDMVNEFRKKYARQGTEKMYLTLKPKLVEQQIKMGRCKLHELLKANDALVRWRRSGARTTNSNHRYDLFPNLLSDKANTPTGPNQVIQSDITYVPCHGGDFAYLSLVTDAWSKKILGWNLSKSLNASGAISALKMAIRASDGKLEGAIHHSDRGVQYCCNKYRSILKDNGLKVSLTEKYDPYENALAERVNNTIKNEYLKAYYFQFSVAARDVKNAIDDYNNHRMHRGLGFLSPCHAHEYGIKLERPSYEKILIIRASISPSS
ncbi:IS3 family transposase [Persicobacter psychrovividus]|uniref:Integrase n=1 Tax=Persicobacter psychrovividus TaxID=387638 RepID=A0ABM7VM04_9BACT|nr:integrase [Persicobacter psychrovividus]